MKMPKFTKPDYSRKYDGHSDKICKTSTIGQQGKETFKSIDENSEILQNFKKYAAILDEKHNKFERLVKISRDVTIESKRIIFLLHSIDRGNMKEKLLQEADKRLQCIMKDYFSKVAKELKEEDPYMFHKAFTCGMQEFIEAFTFYHYLKEKRVYHWDYYQNLLKYKEAKISIDSNEDKTESSANEISTKELLVFLPPLDYILGLADLSGELMRQCISNLGIGDMEGCFETCNVVRNLYTRFLSLGYRTREMSHKVQTLRQSMLKMEKVCYKIHVRSKELPKHIMLEFDLLTEFEYPDKDEEYLG